MWLEKKKTGKLCDMDAGPLLFICF
jgi:hypothetical protein